MTPGAMWRRWVALFEDKDDPAEPHYDPVHLAVVLVSSQVVIGALYWLLWTLFVYEGGLPGEGWRANLTALALCVLLVVFLYKADRRAAQRTR